MKRSLKRLIGKSDKVDFPDWGISAVPVKIDSGAYRSTIDCHDVKVVKNKEGKYLQFILLNPNHPMYTGHLIESAKYRKSHVKSSNGEKQTRYVVKTTIKLFDEFYETEFTLSKREDMKFPILLGRKLLNNNFIIDTSKSNLSWTYTKRKKKKVKF